MVILGIDPGYAIMGYGLIDSSGRDLRALDYGVIETKPKATFPERLEKLYNGVKLLLLQYSPDNVAFEELFFSRNVSTAMQVGAGRGVSMLAVQQQGIALYEYTPMQVKLSVTGNGHGDKRQVQHMVRALLCLREAPRPDDAADALAVAICHAHMAEPAVEEYRIR